MRDLTAFKLVDGKFEHLVQAHNETRSLKGMVAEFGVFTGHSINCLARLNPGEPVYGFDSFLGLPEDWNRTAVSAYPAGHFNLDGKPPPGLEPNVIMRVGWFKESIPQFLTGLDPVVRFRFIHIDSDLYSSALTVLTLCRERMQRGTVICFDEFCDWGGGRARYPEWPNGEYRALREWTTAGRWVTEVEPISRDREYSAAFRVTSVR